MADNDKPKKKAPSIPQPPDPMQALGKASTIGAPQGNWTPLTHGGDAPLVQLMHSVLGNAQRDPQGNYAVNQTNMAGLIGGGGEAPPGGGPIARFLGWQKGLPERGIEHMPLYNVDAPGHPLHRSTVTPQALIQHNIPFTPPPPHNFDAGVVTTGQGMQVPPDFFNSPGVRTPQTKATSPDLNDRITTLLDKFGGKRRDVGPEPVGGRPQQIGDPMRAKVKGQIKQGNAGVPPEFAAAYKDRGPDEVQAVWDAFKKSSLFPGSRFDK